MKSTRKLTKKRIKRLNKEAEKNGFIFPNKKDKAKNRLVKKAKHKPPKSIRKQMKEWEEFQEKMLT
jgi:hypothetical protein